MKRLTELDVMRGLAIVGVVFLHAYVEPWAGIPGWQFTVMHALHLVAQTAVPVFLFASGLLLAREDSQSSRTFWIRKWEKIFLPAAVIMLLTGVARAWLWDWEWAWVREALIRFDISGQYYYIAVLLVLYAVFRVLVRPLPTAAVHVLTVVAFVASLAMTAWYEVHPVGGESAVWAYRNPLVWVFFYAAGYSLARSGLDLDIPRAWIRLACVVAVAAAASFFAQGLVFDAYPISYFGVSVFLFSASTLFIYPAMARQIARQSQLVTTGTAVLSRYALGIFFIHAPFFIGYLDHHVGAWPGDYLLAMTALATFALVGSLAVLVLLDLILPPAIGAFAGLDSRSGPVFPFLRRGQQRRPAVRPVASTVPPRQRTQSR